MHFFEKKTKKTLFQLTSGFVLLQIWGMLFNFIKPLPNKTFAPFSKLIFHSPIILLGIAWFLIVQIVIYIVFTLILFWVARQYQSLFNWSADKIHHFAIGLWWFTILVIFLANQVLFPWSVFSVSSHFFYLYKLCIGLFYFGTSIWAFIFAMAFFVYFMWSLKSPTYNFFLLVMTLIIIIMAEHVVLLPARNSMITFNDMHFTLASKHSVISDFEKKMTKFMENNSESLNASNIRPNIIIIGIDSLRPDMVGFLGKKEFTKSNLDQNFSSKEKIISIPVENTVLKLNADSYWTMQSLTPHLDRFLQNATFFTQAWTPLARTFPAWFSLLTGKNPLHSQARYGLPNPQLLIQENTLAKILMQQHYYTIFATDDRRFNPIINQYGFQQIIAAPTGFNDFVLGTLNDFPLSNLLLNTSWGRFLFPYSYANRSTAGLYQPATFIKFLDQQLNNLPQKQQPIFLGMHLLLPHWPFIYNKMPLFHTENPVIYNRLIFQASVIAADQQVNAMITILKKHHLLDNALVIVMSDHGQATGLVNERVTPIDGLQDPQRFLKKCLLEISHSALESYNNDYAFEAAKANFNDVKIDSNKSCLLLKVLTEPTFGHGTDILNESQYHTILAFKGFGDVKIKSQHIQAPVSLIDIAPTILQFLHIPSQNLMSEGFSLWPLISLLPAYCKDSCDKITATNNNYSIDKLLLKLRKQDLFIESGFNLPGLIVASPNKDKLLQEGLNYFTLDPKTGFLYIRPKLASFIINGKQKAIIEGNWLLAYYPINQKINFLVLANLKTHQWTIDMTSSFAKKARADRLERKLISYYHKEIKNIILF